MRLPHLSQPLARLCALVLLLLPPYWRLLAGEVVYHRDVVRFVYPIRWFLRDAISRGELPLWNPHQGLGFAVLGDPQYGLFYPLNWLLLLPGPLPQMLSWFSFGHLILGACGCMVLAAQLGATGAASIVAGVAFGLAGRTTSEWTSGILMLAAAWIPWTAVGFVHLMHELRTPRSALRAGVLAAVPVAMALLLGEVFLAIMGVGFGVFVALVWRRAYAPSQDRKSWIVAIGAVAGASALGAAVAAISVMPAARFAATTARAAPLSLELAEQWSLHPLHASELLMPGIFGVAWEERPDAPWVRDMFGSGPLNLGIYCGATVIALALVALRRGGRGAPQSAAVSPWLGNALAVACVAALLFSLGAWTPAHRILRVLVPPLAYMRSPEKYLVLVCASLSQLAALGAARLLSAAPVPWRRIAGFGALLLCIGFMARAFFPAELVRYVRGGSAHACAAVLALLATAFVYRSRPTLGRLLLPVCIAVDLGVAVLPIQHFGPPSYIAARPPLAAAILDDAHGRGMPAVPAPRLFRGKRVIDSMARRATLVPALDQLTDNTSVPLGIDILPGYDAAIPPSLAELAGAKRTQVLQLLGVHYALLSTLGPGAERRAGKLEEMLDPFPGTRLYRVNDPLPRAYVAQTVTELPDADRLASLLSPDVVSGVRALVARSDLPVIAVPAGTAQRGDCAIDHYGLNGLDARCTAYAPGLAVFVEQWTPGWQATVDGAPARVVQTNLVCRGVALSAGSHRITLRYEPPGLRAGALISILALLLAAACLWLTRAPVASPVASMED